MQGHQSAGCPAANTQAASERCLRTGGRLEGSDGRLVQRPYQPPSTPQLLPCPPPLVFQQQASLPALTPAASWARTVVGDGPEGVKSQLQL